jgi:hypothetical protein
MKYCLALLLLGVAVFGIVVGIDVISHPLTHMGRLMAVPMFLFSSAALVAIPFMWEDLS